jgi:hypothetical protein
MRIIISESQLKKIVSEQTTKKRHGSLIISPINQNDPAEKDKLFFSNELKKRGWYNDVVNDIFRMTLEDHEGQKNAVIEAQLFNNYAILNQILANDPYVEIKPWYLYYDCLKTYYNPGDILVSCLKMYADWGISGKPMFNEPGVKCFRLNPK